MQGSICRKRRLLGGAAVALVLGLVVPTSRAGAQQAVNAGEVSATGAATAPSGATPQPTQKHVFRSNQTVRVLDRAQMDAAGPVGGAAQVLSYAPGANVVGYGNTGAEKYSVSINGIHQGWTGYSSAYTDTGALAITFDGVPISDVATNLWQSATLPQMSLIQNTNVTYGPGATADRWFNNVGGGIEFTPLQPTKKPGGEVELTYGSNNQKNFDFHLQTGTYHGWSTVLAGGMGNGDNFRNAPDGFNSPSEDYAAYLKTIKTFRSGSLELGGYWGHSGAYRPPVIPTTPQPGVYTTGTAGTVLYSQQTSGYYSTLPFTTYEKKDFNTMGLLYGRINLRLDDTTKLHNLAWYTHIDRQHSRFYDLFSTGAQQYEYNNPHSDAIGDKLWLTEKLPFNTVNVGGYVIHEFYNSRNNFFNTGAPYFGNKDLANQGGKIRSSNFNQDDLAVFLQDDLSPIPNLHITPGIRFVDFQVNYGNSVQQDFALTSGAILNYSGYTACPFTPAGPAPANGYTKTQSAPCGDHQNRTGLEPSIDVSYSPLPWLNLYGGYEEAWKAPQLGGGGGLFQAVDPSTYHLALAQYYQFGFKVHLQHTRLLNNFLFGAAYFHLRYAKQEIDTALANGNTIAANGTSVYHGVNMFLDDNPIYQLHVFGNATIEGAHYTSYITGGVSYNGIPVAYVPTAIANAGAYYDYFTHGVLIEPRIWFQYTGSQHVFDNTIGAPSNQSMPSFGTLNLAVKSTVPLHLGNFGTRYIDLKLTALNVLNTRYNSFEFITSGGYFGTSYGGYRLAYPGAPFSVYGTVGVRF
jgi:iron complex outermembrane receptor protein